MYIYRSFTNSVCINVYAMCMLYVCSAMCLLYVCYMCMQCVCYVYIMYLLCMLCVCFVFTTCTCMCRLCVCYMFAMCKLCVCYLYAMCMIYVHSMCILVSCKVSIQTQLHYIQGFNGLWLLVSQSFRCPGLMRAGGQSSPSPTYISTNWIASVLI